MQREIKHTWYYEHSPEEVWECLTNSELLGKWLMKNDFKPIVGHKFMFHTKPIVNVGFDGKVYCEVLEIIPFKKLSYSWRGGPGNGKIILDSVVHWTLLARDNGTELTLEHKGFNGMKNFLAYFFMNKGWSKILKQKLAEVLNKSK